MFAQVKQNFELRGPLALRPEKVDSADVSPKMEKLFLKTAATS